MKCKACGKSCGKDGCLACVNGLVEGLALQWHDAFHAGLSKLGPSTDCDLTVLKPNPSFCGGGLMEEYKAAVASGFSATLGDSVDDIVASLRPGILGMTVDDIVKDWQA